MLRLRTYINFIRLRTYPMAPIQAMNYLEGHLHERLTRGGAATGMKGAGQQLPLATPTL